MLLLAMMLLLLLWLLALSLVMGVSGMMMGNVMCLGSGDIIVQFRVSKLGLQ